MSDHEPVTMREIRDARNRLMERSRGDHHAYFTHLMDRQKELEREGNGRLVRPRPVR